MEPIEIYHAVLDIVNKFLIAIADLSVEEIDHIDPSVEVIAKKLKLLASLLNGIASGSHDDGNMAMNSFQCCLIMEQIAKAVSARDQFDAEALIEQLKVHANVP